METRAWSMILPLLFAVSGAMADGMEPAAAAAQESEAVTGRVPVRERVRAHTPTRLPQGDIRHCLDLRSNQAIIRCAETGRKR